jgi:hypothetical protein
MLAEFEKKIASLLADALSARTHLTVTQAPGPPVPDAGGKGIAVVSVAEATPSSLYNPEHFELQKNPSRHRRLLPLSFVTTIDFAIKAPGSPGALTASRTLLLDDVALSSHFLADAKIRDGSSFVLANPDPGIKVTEFVLGKIVVNRDPQNGLLTARLECLGQAQIWPPGTVQPAGEIKSIDVNLLPQPISVAPLQPTIRMGGVLPLRIRGLPSTRGPKSAPGPFAVGVRVLSDVPPDQRGTITNGIAGAESNLRIIAAVSPETELQYRAPAAGVKNVRIEVVTIFFATPEGKQGAFLGAVPISVLGGN